MKTNSPVNLNLLTLRFPVTAVASILHRITGVMLLIGIPVLLCGLQCALRSPESFAHLQTCLGNPFAKAVLFVILACVIFHAIAGIKHMLMDFVLGESLRVGRVGAYCVFGLSILCIAIEGYWLWIL